MRSNNLTIVALAECHTNLGKGMDAKSGIFSAPLPGAYMFTVHACAHDQHKALLTLRKNGIQVASFYDQVRSLSLIHGGKGFALLRHLLAGLCTIRKLKRKFSVLEKCL